MYSLTIGMAVSVPTVTNGKVDLITDKWQKHSESYTNGKAVLLTDKWDCYFLHTDKWQSCFNNWQIAWRDIDSDFSSIVKLKYHNDIPEACSAEQVLAKIVLQVKVVLGSTCEHLLYWSSLCTIKFHQYIDLIIINWSKFPWVKINTWGTRNFDHV